MNEEELVLIEQRKRYAIQQSLIASLKSTYTKEFSRYIWVMTALLLLIKSKNTKVRFLSIPICLILNNISSYLIDEYYKAKYF
jgi:hypothetical protein